MKLLSNTFSYRGRAKAWTRLFIPLFLFCCLSSATSYAMATVTTCMGTTKVKPDCTSSLSGGAWSSSDNDIATVDPVTGLVTGVAPGTVTISYSGSDACGTFTYPFVVLPLPDLTISGPSAVCLGLTTTLGGAPSGGTWTSDNTSVATVGVSSGVVSGIAAGTVLISYTATNAEGCAATTNKVFTVNALPNAGTITGTFVVCEGSVTTVSDAVGGGTWSTSNSAVATVDASGMITGVAAGTTTITYSVVSGDGCVGYATHDVTVNPLPAAIYGSSSVVAGFEITLSDAAAGGTWSSSNTAIGTIGSATGIVRGITQGVTNISYTLSTGCYVTKAVSVNTLSVCEIAPMNICDSILAYCNGFTVQVGNVPAGASVTWSPTVTPTPSTAGSVWTYTFTTAPPSGIRTYTITATLGGYSTTKVVKIWTAPTSERYPCNSYKPLCPSECPDTYPFTTIYAPNKMITGAQISTAGHYYIPNIPTLDSVVLKVSPVPGSVFLVDSGVFININPGDSIALDSCHFFRTTPFGQPGGFVLKTTSSTMTKLRIVNNTLIEHFQYGVLVRSFTPTTTPATGSYLLEVNEAIFNNNFEDIHIDLTDVPAAYKVTNSIFTNRKLCTYKVAGTSNCDINYSYPFSWPTVSYLRTGVDSGLYPIMTLDDFEPLPNNCIGIKLQNVGTTAGSGSSATYNSIIIGDSATKDNVNIFDSRLGSNANGVYVSESNVYLYNNIFRNSYNGVTTVSNGTKHLTQLDKGLALQTHNRFYNCSTAVTFAGYKLIAKNAQISANNKSSRLFGTPPATYKGGYGYQINATLPTSSTFDYIEISDNIISNVEIGIKTTNLDTGELVIKNNTLNGVITPADSSYGEHGIWVSGKTSGIPIGKIRIFDNGVSGYEIGVRVTGYMKPSTINNNTIMLKKQPYSAVLTGVLTTGTSAYADSICHNHIYGDGASVTYNTPTGTGYAGFELTGMGSSADTTLISCNYVHDVEHGFIFHGTNTLKWINNVMSHNKYGMKLDGTIGDQGDAAACIPADNYWVNNTDASWLGWGNAANKGFATYVTTSGSTSASKLFVRSASGFDPSAMTGANSGSTAYAGGSTIIVATCTPASAQNCSAYNSGGSYPASRMANSSSNDVQSSGITNLRADGISYSIFPNPAEDNISIRSSVSSDATVQVTIRNYAAQVVYSGKQKLKNGLANIKLPNAASGMYMVTVTDDKGQSQQFKLAIQGNSNRAGN